MKKPRGRPFQRGTDPRRNVVPPGTEPRAIGAPCPQCSDGRLVLKSGPYGDFVACSAYPRCLYKQQMGQTPGHAAYVPASHLVAPVAPLPATPTPEPQTMPLAQPTAAPGSIEAAIRAIAEHAAAQSVNADQVNAIVDRRVDGLLDTVQTMLAAVSAPAPKCFTVTVNNAAAIQIDGAAHNALPALLRRCAKSPDGTRPFRNLSLTGPAGSGKTVLAAQLNQALGFAHSQFACLAAAQDLPSSALTGRQIPNLTDGSLTYIPSTFATWYECGGVYLLDEGDNMDASTQLAVNAALDNGHWTRPDGVRITRHADAVFVLAMNTWGNGQSREYVGRTQLDGAFLDRFIGAQLFLDYDAELERALIPDDAIRSRVQKIRADCRKLNLRRIVSTRAVIATATLVTRCGFTLDEALREITPSWTPEDRSAVGIR